MSLYVAELAICFCLAIKDYYYYYSRSHNKAVHNTTLTCFLIIVKTAQEDDYVSKNLQLLTSGRQKTTDSDQVFGAFPLPTRVETPAAYKRAKYPYASVNRASKHENALAQQSVRLDFLQVYFSCS